MTSNTIRRIQKIYAVAVTAITIIAGLCLMAACIGIYLSGDEPYSRESVAAAFSPISVPVYLCLGIVLLGFILDLLLPKEERRRTVAKQHKLILSRLRSKADMAQCDIAVRSQIENQQHIRRINMIATAALLCLGGVVFLAYILSADRFPLSDVNGSVIRAVITALLCMTIPFGYAIVSAYWSVRSMEKEIDLLKQVPKHTCAEPVPVKKEHSLLLPRLAFLAAGIVLLVYGFFTGGTADVLVKAINICTECVGLG